MTPLKIGKCDNCKETTDLQEVDINGHKFNLCELCASGRESATKEEIDEFLNKYQKWTYKN